jgi:hypothetical protein
VGRGCLGAIGWDNGVGKNILPVWRLVVSLRIVGCVHRSVLT